MGRPSPGQYLRIGVDIRGVRHWRAYSLTSEPDRPDGWISITPKLVEEGVVSPYLVRHGRPGAIVSLGGVEGEFVLPEPLPGKLLFISAGSGITPIMSMLRSLCREERLGDAVLIHSARTPEEVIFGGELRHIDRSFPGFRLHGSTPRRWAGSPRTISTSCARTGASARRSPPAPGRMLDALTEHWEREGRSSGCTWSASSPSSAPPRTGEGGTIKFVARIAP